VGGSKIFVVNSKTLSIGAEIPVPGRDPDLNYIAASQDGASLYAATGLGSGQGYSSQSLFEIINLESHKLTASTSTNQFLTDIVATKNPEFAYVTHLGGTQKPLSLETFNSSGASVGKLRVGTGSSGIAITEDGAVAFLATQEAGIVELDGSTLKEVAAIPNSAFGFDAPGGLAISANGRRLCVLAGDTFGFGGMGKVWIVSLPSVSSK
jgi:DNA-binding beta-propeller fold protein YncE